ncbi:hypothetical protein HD806DRAFT_524644 [Xylariaceae sp. AK1471]|nr:hypothetical protein HD806DRAFT_524644 [Xylariaceae sp. AK1471]
MPSLLSRSDAFLKVGIILRGKKKTSPESSSEGSTITKVVPIDEGPFELMGDLPNHGCWELEGSPGTWEVERPLKPILKSPVENYPRPSPVRKVAFRQTVLFHEPPVMPPCLEAMPVEIVEHVLGHLDDYKDLLNAMRASRLLYSVFKGAKVRIQTQVTLNRVEPGVLDTVLAVFYCRRDTHQLNEHLQKHLDGTATFSFPSRPSEIGKLYSLYKTVQYVGEKLVAKSLLYNSRKLEKGDIVPVGFGVSLTTSERVSLEKTLLRYELIALAIGYAEDYASEPLTRVPVPARLQHKLFTSLEPVEFQQLVTVDAWILSDYQEWEQDFQHSFIDEIVAASEKVKASSPLPSSNPTRKINSGTKPSMINARLALGNADLAATIPYLCQKQRWEHGRWEADRLLARLQSNGLSYYKNMCESEPAVRHKVMLEAHKRLEYMESDFLGCGIRYYALRVGKVPYLWWDHMKFDDLCPVPFPNTFVEHYVMTLDRLDHMHEEVRNFLLQTGWWFWGDARLNEMAFTSHPVFREGRSDKDQKKALEGWARVSRTLRRAEPKMPKVLLGEDVELPLAAWKEIILKYQQPGTELPDFFLADDHYVIASQMWA